MSATNGKQLKFGIPKGSLQDATVALLEKAGWKINLFLSNRQTILLKLTYKLLRIINT